MGGILSSCLAVCTLAARRVCRRAPRRTRILHRGPKRLRPTMLLRTASRKDSRPPGTVDGDHVRRVSARRHEMPAGPARRRRRAPGARARNRGGGCAALNRIAHVQRATGRRTPARRGRRARVALCRGARRRRRRLSAGAYARGGRAGSHCIEDSLQVRPYYGRHSLERRRREESRCSPRAWPVAPVPRRRHRRARRRHRRYGGSTRGWG
mmetsp:Transcript_2334/g.6565  ORF Transcript_2334/g.6565 Transcript_2334/m.6565 type:complete len:210 (-) Transcript_2334:1123-1752(-)